MGGGTLVIRQDHTEGEQGTASYNIVFDKTWREVRDALANGIYVVVVSESDRDSVHMTLQTQQVLAKTDSGEGYTVETASPNAPVLYACSEDGYLQSKSCGGIS